MHPYVNLMWKYTVTKTKLKAIHKLYLTILNRYIHAL